MKVLKILLKLGLGLVLVLVAAGAAGYFLFVKPAPAEDVCENFFEISLQEARSQLAAGTSVSPDEVGFSREDLYRQVGMTPEQCVEKEERGRRSTTRGLIPVATISKCQAKASTLAEFESCGS